MAACVLTLLATAFLPIIGVKFDWLGLHWMTGVVLALLVVCPHRARQHLAEPGARW